MVSQASVSPRKRAEAKFCLCWSHEILGSKNTIWELELLIYFPLCSNPGSWICFRAVVCICFCPSPPPFLQRGGVTLLSSRLLANVIFMVLTPEPSALGMRLLQDLVLGKGWVGVGRQQPSSALGAWSPSVGFISLISGLMPLVLSQGISKESPVESST